MFLELKESNSPFWLIGANKVTTFCGSSTNTPCYYKSSKKQKELATQILKNNKNVIDVYLLTGTQWDNMPSSSGKEELGYLKNKGKLILSRDDVVEGAYPKGVSRDPLPKDGVKVYTSPVTALEDKNKGVEDMKLELKEDNLEEYNIDDTKLKEKFDDILANGGQKDFEALSKDELKQFADYVKSLDGVSDLIKGIILRGLSFAHGDDLSVETESTNDELEKVTESKIVTPVGNPQTAGSFVNIEVDLDHMEVSDFIVRLAQVVRSEQTAILEYVALRSANGITNEDRNTIDEIIKEEKNHMAAITTLLYKQILINHKENVDEANSEFTLPKFGADLFTEDNKLEESVNTIINKVEEKAISMSDEYFIGNHEDGRMYHGLGLAMNTIKDMITSTGDEVIIRNVTLSDKQEDISIKFDKETMSQEQWDIVIDVDYDADFQMQIVNNLTNAIRALNSETYKNNKYAIAEDKYTLAGDKFNFTLLTYNGFEDTVDESFIEMVCNKLFEKASTYDYWIKRA